MKTKRRVRLVVEVDVEGETDGPDDAKVVEVAERMASRMEISLYGDQYVHLRGTRLRVRIVKESRVNTEE